MSDKSKDQSEKKTEDVVVEMTNPATDEVGRAAAEAAAEKAAAQKAAAEKAALEKSRREEGRLEKKFKRGTMLVAEDDAGLQNALVLEAEERGFSVVRANDGAEALRKTTTQHFDVILIDMNLPKKLGHEVVAEIRSSARGLCRDSVIVVLSGYLKKEVVESLVGKIQKAFTKPADIEEVIDTVSALVEKKTGQKTGQKTDQKAG